MPAKVTSAKLIKKGGPVFRGVDMDLLNFLDGFKALVLYGGDNFVFVDPRPP